MCDIGENENKKNPLVSAVIVTHNREELVQKAIASVVNQTYSPMEIIVVDDASTDNTPNILEPLVEKYGLQYIYIPEEESKGGNYARNVGILAAQGKYIAFLDDDDEWMPEKTEKQVEFLENHPECGVCHCGRIRDYNFGAYQKPVDVTTLSEGDVHVAACIRPQCVTSMMMVERDLLLEVGMFDEDIKYWQEYELGIRLFEKTNLGVVRENLVLYRIIKNDHARLTNNLSGWEDAVRKIYEKHAEKMKTLSENDLNRRDLFHYRDGANRSNACGDKKKQKEYLWKIYRISKKPLDLSRAILNKSSYKEGFKMESSKNAREYKLFR